eukprot:Pgem_evm1s985
MAASVEALGVLKETGEVGASIRRLLFVLELKTRYRCTANTIEKEHSLKEASFGTYVTIDLSNENSGKRLRDILPDQKHRLQLLQHMVIMGVH